MLNDLQTKKYGELANLPALSCTQIASNGAYGCRRSAGVGYYDSRLNITLVSWCGGGMDVYLAAFDHRSNVWGAPRRLRRNNMHGTWDYHNYPVMAQAPNGEPRLFYVCHTQRMYQLEPVTPGGWNGRYRRRVISRDACCYPHPVAAGEDLYLFYSKNDDPTIPYRTLRYIVSHNSGASWSRPSTVVDTRKRDPLHFEEVYQCGACYVPAGNGHPAHIQLSFTMWGGPKGHAQEGKGSYFCFLSLEDFHIYGADSADCGKVLHLDDLQKHCLLDQAFPTAGRSHTCGGIVTSAFPDGSPVVCYSQRDEETPDGRIVAAKLQNGQWMKTVLETGTYTLKDCKAMEDGTVRVVYCKGRHCVVREYRDGKWQYAASTQIPLGGRTDSVPWVTYIDHARPEAQLLMSTIELEQAHKNYSGCWPITCLGITPNTNKRCSNTSK